MFTPTLLKLLVERCQGLLRRERRPDRAEGVVLVHAGQPEHGHDRVADVLLDPAAVVLEDRAHLVEVAGHDLAQRLGVERLAEIGRALQVGEEDRDGLSSLLRGQLHDERGPAEPAQPEARRVLFPAIRADLHRSSVGRASVGH